MSSLIDKRNHHRRSIRRAHLDGIFKQRRLLLQTVISDQAKDILVASLNALKSMLLHQHQDEESVNSLAMLHSIARDYNCIDRLCQFVCFTPEEAGTELASKNPTWVDLLLEVVRREWEEWAVSEQASGVLAEAAYQLSLKVKDEAGSHYYQQTRRLTENYPYHLLREESACLVSNTLQVVEHVCTSGPNSAFLYHLLTKTTPPLLKLLNLLHARPLMALEEVGERYSVACILLVTMAKRYNLEHLQSERYESMCRNLRAMCLQELQSSRSKEEFSRACLKLATLSKVEPNPSIQETDFRKFEDYLSREIAEENEAYFKLLEQNLYNSTHKLTQASFRRLTAYLFHQKHEHDGTRLPLRLIILRILRLHIINNGNRMAEEELSTLTELWGECGFALHDLAEVLQLEEEGSLQMLFEVVSHVIVGPGGSELITEGYLFSLLKYGQFREMLQSLGYSLSGMEEDEWDMEAGYE